MLYHYMVDQNSEVSESGVERCTVFGTRSVLEMSHCSVNSRTCGSKFEENQKKVAAQCSRLIDVVRAVFC